MKSPYEEDEFDESKLFEDTDKYVIRSFLRTKIDVN